MNLKKSTIWLILQYPINGIVLCPSGSTVKLHIKIHSLKKRRQNKNVKVIALKACSNHVYACIHVFLWNKDLPMFFPHET